MVCKKCGTDYSHKVWQVHKERCNGVQEKQEKAKAAPKAVDTFEAFEKDDLIEYAEALGVEIDKRWGKARIIDAINGD